MEWTDIRLTVAKADAENAEAVATLIAEGGIYIEDYSDIEQQVAEIAHVDLIEQELRDKDRSVVAVHLYLSPDENPAEGLELTYFVPWDEAQPGDLLYAFSTYYSVSRSEDNLGRMHNIDLAAARARGITVCNIPAYSSQRVAHTAIMLLLCLSSSMGSQIRMLERGDRSNFTRCLGLDHVEVNGKTIGLIGAGNIGRAVMKIALALDMEVLVYSRTPRDYGPGVTCVSLEELLRRSDYVSLHCPLTDATRHLINRDTLSLMKPTAFLINTSRGALVDEAALIDALKARCPNLPPVRINTNGHAALFLSRDVTHELSGRVDTVSISLNGSTAEEYVSVTRPRDGVRAWEAMLDFTREAVKYVPEVVMTIVDKDKSPEEIAACRAICEGLGARFRVRSYIED